MFGLTYDKEWSHRFWALVGVPDDMHDSRNEPPLNCKGFGIFPFPVLSAGLFLEGQICRSVVIPLQWLTLIHFPGP